MTLTEQIAVKIMDGGLREAAPRRPAAAEWPEWAASAGTCAKGGQRPVSGTARELAYDVEAAVRSRRGTTGAPIDLKGGLRLFAALDANVSYW